MGNAILHAAQAGLLVAHIHHAGAAQPAAERRTHRLLVDHYRWKGDKKTAPSPPKGNPSHANTPISILSQQNKNKGNWSLDAKMYSKQGHTLTSSGQHQHHTAHIKIQNVLKCFFLKENDET